jgi:hypothetical protein
MPQALAISINGSETHSTPPKIVTINVAQTKAKPPPQAATEAKPPPAEPPTASWSVNTAATAASVNNGNSGANASPNGGIYTVHQTFKNASECPLTVSQTQLSSQDLGALGNCYWKHFYVEPTCSSTSPSGPLKVGQRSKVPASIGGPTAPTKNWTSWRT